MVWQQRKIIKPLRLTSAVRVLIEKKNIKGGLKNVYIYTHKNVSETNVRRGLAPVAIVTMMFSSRT